jgi:parallel beta-helix repeat protein
VTKKAVYSLVLVFVLMGVLGVSINVPKVEAPYPIIFIKADGSIDPPTADITSSDNVTYTFVADINASIVVERSNIVIDGNGYTLQGTGAGNGTDLSGRSNVTIKNTRIKSFQYGIMLYSSLNNSVSENNITNNDYGIVIDFSYNNSISGNNITANNYDGIYLYSSSNNNISGNTLTNNSYDGIWLDSSSNNNINGNTMAKGGDGIWLDSSSNNNINGNNITNNYSGIDLQPSSNYNSISGNNITNNQYGIGLYSSSNYNSIYHNNFNNTHNAYSNGFSNTSNTWDDGYPSGGNYWSDYIGTNSNYDGIGDIPYVIDADDRDYFPLMGMFSDFKATSEHHVQTICNSSIADFQFNGTAIMFNVSGENGTSGFCRICIPTALMNGTYRVFVNGDEISCNLLSFSNETYSYLYFNYTHSTHEIIIIPEFPSFLILPIFMVITIFAIIVYTRKREKLKVYLRFLNSFIPSISVTYWKPCSIRVVASCTVVAVLQVYSSSPFSMMPLM